VYQDDGIVVFSSQEQDRLRSASQAISNSDARNDADTVSPACLSGCINIPEVQVHGATVTLRFTLPAAYPEVIPSLQIIANAPR